ncbi:MAG TPA: polysaccharide biosynthesis/export family protein [Dissulfurispiraceae bacterium]|nr:polysaccharide biosynthesis/export family protein [Dissulfurispiraceae bacterium]
MKRFTMFLVALIVLLSGKSYGEDFVMGPTDVLSISVWGNPELSVPQMPIRPDGMISVPLIGDIKAGGMTPDQLKTLLEKEYTKYIKAPSVSVIVTAINSVKFNISVVGAVKNPGLFPYKKSMTALDAVLSAGGFTEFASQNSVVIIRPDGNIGVKLKDVINGDASKNVELKPGDIVRVKSGLF